MIKIDKDPYPPEVRFVKANHTHLGQIKWRVAEKLMLLDFRNNPKPFFEGKYVFSSDFGYHLFRDALEKCQGSKCCFCEKPFGTGQIEHFRPKAAWKQARATPLVRPGYYWLAYRWDNMLISCPDCNASGQKGNLFPVTNPRGGAHSNCKSEKNWIINPAEEDPAKFISFNLDQPVAVAANARGQLNIETFKLKTRGDIVTIRRDHLALYQAQRDIASLPHPIGAFTQKRIDEAKNHIRVAQKSKQPFAGMIRENLKKGLI